MNDNEAAGDHLRLAIQQDKNLLLRAIGDPNFIDVDQFLETNLSIMHKQLLEIADAAESALRGEQARVENIVFQARKFARTFTLSKVIPDAKATLARNLKLIQNSRNGGIVEIRNSLEELPVLYDYLTDVEDQFRTGVEDELRTEFE